jgi:hypothetical protein
MIYLDGIATQQPSTPTSSYPLTQLMHRFTLTRCLYVKAPPNPLFHISIHWLCTKGRFTMILRATHMFLTAGGVSLFGLKTIREILPCPHMTALPTRLA